MHMCRVSCGEGSVEVSGHSALNPTYEGDGGRGIEVLKLTHKLPLKSVASIESSAYAIPVHIAEL